MRNAGRLFQGLLLAAVLALPVQVQATSYEDDLEDCSYPMMFDLVVMRPISLGTLALGTVLLVPLAPWTAVTSPGHVGDVADRLVRRPARFTFGRPLGECATQ